jgi:hypothetical protein
MFRLNRHGLTEHCGPAIIWLPKLSQKYGLVI